MAETIICSATEYDLMERGLKTAKDMLADIKAGEPDTDPALRMPNAEPYLEECISWLEQQLSVCQVGEGTEFSILSEDIEEAMESERPLRVPCTPVEYNIIARSIPSEEHKIAISKKRGKPGTVIGDYAEVGMRILPRLKKRLGLYFPVGDYRHPNGGTVVSIRRGGQE